LDKFLKSFPVGMATFFLGGHFTVLDKNGRKKDEGDVGLFWDPRDLHLQEDDRVVFENQVEIRGIPGPGIHYEIVDYSISEGKHGKRTPPAIINVPNKVTIWRSEGTIAAFINGRLRSDNWVVSYQESFSGRIFFDAAENKIRDEKTKSEPVHAEPAKPEVQAPKPDIDDSKGHKPADEPDPATMVAIVDSELKGDTRSRNKGETKLELELEAGPDKAKKPRTGSEEAAPNIKTGTSIKDVIEDQAEPEPEADAEGASADEVVEVMARDKPPVNRLDLSGFKSS
jgi:hypothetical protein